MAKDAAKGYWRRKLRKLQRIRKVAVRAAGAGIGDKHRTASLDDLTIGPLREFEK
jgi:hypothetical protein